MRVLQLGVQVQFEVRVERQLLVAHLDVPVLTTLNDGTRIHRLDDSINGVAEVLNQEGLSTFDSCLKHLDHLRVGETSDFKVICLLTTFKPGDTLELRVNDEWVTIGVCQDGTIFSRHAIGR